MPVMTRMWHRALAMLAALCCTSSMAAGVLKLSRTELTLAPDTPVPELWAENVGDTPLYLDVTQQLVMNPGESPERLVLVTEVPRPTLLVFPDRLALAPGQKYRVALKELGMPEHAQAWRLTFRPRERVVVDSVDGSGIEAPLVVSVGYGVVIYQMPRRMHE
nr:hypothetical protein [Burkholderia cepacia]